MMVFTLVQGHLLCPRINRLGVLPPPSRKGNPGRPSNYHGKKERNENVSSSSSTKLSCMHRVMTCSNCKEEGHNKADCTNSYVDNQPKKSRGGQLRKSHFCFHLLLSSFKNEN